MEANELATIGSRIRWLIEEKLRVTPTEFADQLGVKLQQLSRWINDPSKPPSERSLARIAGKGGVGVEWLRYGGSATDQDGALSAHPEEVGAGWLAREIDRINRELPTERERALAIDVRSSAVRAVAMLEAERARRQAEQAREEAERAARQRAEAAIEDARSRKVAEERALIMCRATKTSDDGRKGPDALPPPEEQPPSGP